MTHSFHFMCISVLHVSFLCVVALCGQKRVLDPLKLELQMAVSHHRGAGNPTRSSLQEQQMFSTANLSFQPFCFVFNFYSCVCGKGFVHGSADVLGAQKRVLVSLELELQGVMSLLVWVQGTQVHQ